MEANYEVRERELLEECIVAPQVFRGAVERLSKFIEPWAEHLVRTEHVDPG